MHMVRRVISLASVWVVLLLSACGTTVDQPSGSNAGAAGLAAGGSASGSAGSAGALTAGNTFAGAPSAGAPAGGVSSAGSAGMSTAGGGTSGTGATAGASGSSGVSGAAGAGGAATSSGDIVGKVTVGYQGWFNAANDGSGIQPPWWHWSADRNLPSAANNGIKSWPEVSEITKTYATGFGNLGNGSAAKLYSNWDKQTVDAHFEIWKKQGMPIAQQPTEMDFGYTFVACDPDGHRLRVFAPHAQ